MTSPAPGAAPQRGEIGSLPLPPGPRGRRVRNLRERLFDFGGLMDRLHGRYGDIVFYRLPGVDFCALFDANLIRELFIERPQEIPFFRDTASYGVMTNPVVFGSEGKEHRALHDTIVAGFEENMPFHAGLMVEHVLAAKARWRDAAEIDALDEARNIVRSIMLEGFFGRGTQVDPALAKEMLWALKWDWAISFFPVRTAFLRALPIPQNRRARAVIERWDDAAYEKIRSARESPGGEDFMSHFVRAGQQEHMRRLGLLQRPDQIRDEVISAALGNSDTPISAVVFTMWHLSRNPAVRERVEQEVDEALGDRPITPEDHARLPYTQAVVRESLRVSPPAYSGNAQLTRARVDSTLGGYRIPKGTVVHPCAGVVHCNPDYWDGAGDFRPERWLAPEGPSRPGCPEHAYIPFGLGKRICPGADYASTLVALATASFAQTFRIDPVGSAPPRREPLGAGLTGTYRVRVSLRRARRAAA